jgi:hypothetical protein
MKRVLLAVLLFCILLFGCSKNEDKAVDKILTNKEFAEIYWDLGQVCADVRKEKGELAVYGTSDDNEEKIEHARPIYNEAKQKYLDQYGYKLGDRVKITFKPNGETKVADDGSIYCYVFDETEEYFKCPIYFKDDSIVGKKSKAVIVEGEFTDKYGDSMRRFDECTVLEQ